MVPSHAWRRAKLVVWEFWSGWKGRCLVAKQDGRPVVAADRRAQPLASPEWVISNPGEHAKNLLARRTRRRPKREEAIPHDHGSRGAPVRSRRAPRRNQQLAIHRCRSPLTLTQWMRSTPPGPEAQADTCPRAGSFL